MQVFISYKREDAGFAHHLHNTIQSWGFRPWLDKIDIQPGEDWDAAIHTGLKNSQIVLGFLTPESLASKNVLDEWGYALSTNKRLFLLWLRDVPEADIPPRHIRNQRIDFRHDQSAGLLMLKQAFESATKFVPQSVSYVDNTNIQPILPEYFSESQDDQSLSLEYIEHNSNRFRMLEKVRMFWVKGVLEQSVHKATLIELGIQRRPDAIENPWKSVLQHHLYGDYELPSDTKIVDLYQELNGELLILGDPGSGKTTTLLELARDLIVQAEKDHSLPIPVVFNLSSWADERESLSSWLIKELNDKYQVPRKVGQEWVEGNQILLLLDGLDEVDSRYRNDCVKAINDFRGEHGFIRIVVCSRLVDYENLSTRFKLNGAVVIKPLTEEQIDHYLANLGPSMKGVRSVMAVDQNLRKLAESPLMLNIMSLAYSGIEAEDMPLLATVEEQRTRLFEVYVDRMFKRKMNAEPYSKEKTIYWLNWLAKKMVANAQTVFLIEDMQPNWLTPGRQQRLYWIVLRVPLIIAGFVTIFAFNSILGGLEFGFISGVIGGLLGGISNTLSLNQDGIIASVKWFTDRLIIGAYLVDRTFQAIITAAFISVTLGVVLSFFSEPVMARLVPGAGMIGGIWGAMIAAFIVGITNPEESIQTVEALSWSLKLAMEYARRTLPYTLTFGILVVVFFALVGNPQAGIVFVLGAFTVMFSFLGILGGLRGNRLTATSIPNQGIFQSARNALIWGFVIGGVEGFLGISTLALVNNLPDAIVAGGFFGVLVTLGVMTFYGGAACIKHLVLRAILQLEGDIPNNYAKFLNYASDRVFLRKVGGSYIFIHRYLLEYFAEL